MPKSKDGDSKSEKAEKPRLDLILGYDPLRAPSRSAKVTPDKREHRREHQKTAKPPRKTSKGSLKQESRPPKLVPRDQQRNESPWIPEPLSTTCEDKTKRDSFSNDIFYQAYHDPALRKLSEEWQQRITKGRQRGLSVASKRSSTASLNRSDTGKSVS